MVRFLNPPRVGIPADRDRGVDALRGFAILLVVLGHSISNAENLLTASRYNSEFVLHNLLYTFHMPLFFLISGYVLFGKKIRVRDRALRLLVPFAAWIPVYYLVFRYLIPVGNVNHISDRLIVLSPLGGYFLNVLKEPQRGLWFLPTLFLCSLLIIPATYLEKKKSWLGPVALAAIFVAINLLPAKIGGVRLDLFGVMQIKYFFAFVAVGYLSAKHRPAIERLGRRKIDLILVVFSVLFFALFFILYRFGRIHPYTFPYTLYDFFKAPLGYLIRYSIAGLGIGLSILLIRAARSGTARDTLAWFGLVTMDIYVAHGIMLHITFGSGWVKVLVSFVSAILFSLALSLLLLRRWWPSSALFLGLRRAKTGEPPVLSGIDVVDRQG